jgi:PTH1 family peptidyl-tRNA hydrolase
MAIEVVLGLGNPGQEYVGTRHNVGFRVVDEIARRRDLREWLHRPTCELAVITARQRGYVVLGRPLTYMNRSGDAAQWLLDELGVSSESMLVVVDDIDLPLGSIRLRKSGGPGTHNGLRDLCDKVSDRFPRLRVGVRGADLSGDLADYVLSPFGVAEREAAKAAVLRAADAVEATLREGFDRAMNEFNRPPA